MAKKKQVDLVGKAETAVRNALIDSLPGLSEAEYTEKALNALDLVVEGLKMRLQELQREDWPRGEKTSETRVHRGRGPALDQGD